MTARASPIGNDVHLHPLYLKIASDSFSDGKIAQGMAFFDLASSNPRILEHRVYKQMWKIKVLEDGSRVSSDSEYGRKCFHGEEGLSSSAREKSLAINRCLRKEDQNELQMKENKIHGCLWKIHGPPQVEFDYGKNAFCHLNQRSSSLVQKIAAVKMYADESRVMTWLTERGEVQLIKRADGRLERLAFDDVAGQIGISIINTGPHSTDAAINILLQCDATVNEGVVSFPPFQACPNWPGPIVYERENRELNLLSKDNNLVWRLFDMNTKTVSWTHAYEDVNDALIHMGTVRRLEGRCCLQDFIIDLQATRINRIFSADLNMIEARSRLDPNVKIDSANWAITLFVPGELRSKRSSSPNLPAILAGHAMLAIEGVEAGRPFLRYAHLTAHEKVSPFPTVQIIDENNEGELPIRSQSQTWIRKRHWAQKMIAAIKQEVGKEMAFEITNDSLTPQGLMNVFNWFAWGERPVFKENCLVWSIKKLWMTGIESPEWNYFPVPVDYVREIAANPELVKFNPACNT